MSINIYLTYYLSVLQKIYNQQGKLRRTVMNIGFLGLDSQYIKISTNCEVYTAILVRHRKDLVVVSTVTSANRRMIEYGFADTKNPLIGIDIRWSINRENKKCENEERKYWLCVPV